MTVDTGGLDDAARGRARARARARSAPRDHLLVDARRAFFDRRAALPRLRQRAARRRLPALRRRRARAPGAEVARVARARSAPTRSRTAAPAPATTRCASRSRCARSRPSSRSWRRSATSRTRAPRRSPPRRRAGCRCPPRGAAYSVNRGLWGATIGGRETHDSGEPLPEDGVGADPRRLRRAARRPSATGSAFERGVPSAWDGEALDPVALIERLEAAAAPFGIGRGIHLGDTILGIKGRVAFEAPAAEVLLTAHRELEKLVLTGAPAAAQGLGRRRLRRLGARGPAPRARRAATPRRCSPRRRSASPARSGCCFRPGCAASSRASVAVLADGGLARRLRRGRRRVDRAPTRAGFSRLAGAARRCSTPRGGATRSAEAVRERRSIVSTRSPRSPAPAALKREVRVSTEIPCEEGVVVAVRVLTDKSTYNQLELPSGRMAQVKRGDVIAGALGHRKALFGYSGPPARARSRPATRSTSSTSAACSASATRSTPTSARRSRARCSGTVLAFPYLGERIGVPARIGDGAARPAGDAARRSRRAGRGAGRLVHERRQDRRGLRAGAASSRTRGLHGRRRQGDRRLAPPRHARDGGRRRARAPRSSPTSAWSRRRRPTRRR